MAQGTCFVIMGFGKKTDYSTGRVLDLDKTYRAIIKPAAESAGLTCVRADEVRHSGIIDVPMYRHILEADLVIADLSTYNPNAFYELGVRHALRPFATIVLAESQFKNPFDVEHTAITYYPHLGEGIDFEEALKLQGQLRDLILAILSRRDLDSPVYTYLRDLRPPSLHVTRSGGMDSAFSYGREAAPPTISSLRETGDKALAAGDFRAARESFAALRELDRNNPYLLQRLALATYRSAEPTVREALEAARGLLQDLEPEQSADPETLGLWGTVHRRLWHETGDLGHLDTALFAYEKGFYLRNDYYNGINLAHLLDLRASLSGKAEGIADAVNAERYRRRVIALCEGLLATGQEREDLYWIHATLAEAWLGVGEPAASQEWRDRAFALDPPAWQRESTEGRLAHLARLLEKSPKRQLAAG